MLQTGEFWALSAGVFWALAVVLFRVAGRDVPPLVLNLFKNVVGLLCFFPVLALQGEVIPSWSTESWLAVVLSGVLGITIADTMFFMALNRLGAGLNAVVDCLYFPILAVLARLFLGQTVTLGALIGGALVALGILVGALEPAPEGTDRRQIIGGVAIGAIGMLVVGIGVIIIDDVLSGDTVLLTTSYRLLAGTIVLIPLVALRPERRLLTTVLRPGPWWRAALPGSVSGGALAMWSWLYGFALAPVAIAAILNQLSTIWIFILAAIGLREPVTWRRLFAVLLAFAGVATVIWGG